MPTGFWDKVLQELQSIDLVKFVVWFGFVLAGVILGGVVSLFF